MCSKLPVGCSGSPTSASMPWPTGSRLIFSAKSGAFTAVFRPATPQPANDGSFHPKILGELLLKISLDKALLVWYQEWVKEENMKSKILGVLSFVFLFVTIPQLSQAQTVQFQTFGPYEFRPMSFGVNYIPIYGLTWIELLPDSSLNEAYLAVSGASFSMNFTVPIMKNLDGKRIFKITLFARDNGPSNVRVQLFRRNHFTRKLTELADFSTIDASEGWRTFNSYLGHRFSMGGYSYFFVVYIPPTTAMVDLYYIGAIRIEYTD